MWYEPEYVLIATVLTASMFTGLTLYACFTKRDLTKCWGVAMGLGFALIGMIFLSFFFWSYILYMLICCVGIVLMALYILIDTQLIMKKLKFDEYIVGALMLYTDVITMFIYILGLFGGGN